MLPRFQKPVHPSCSSSYIMKAKRTWLNFAVDMRRLQAFPCQQDSMKYMVYSILFMVNSLILYGVWYIIHGCFHKLGVLFVGVLMTRTLRLGSISGPPFFNELPMSPGQGAFSSNPDFANLRRQWRMPTELHARRAKISCPFVWPPESGLESGVESLNGCFQQSGALFW